MFRLSNEEEAKVVALNIWSYDGRVGVLELGGCCYLTVPHPTRNSEARPISRELHDLLLKEVIDT